MRTAFVPAKAPLFQRGELSPQATEGCCGSEGSRKERKKSILQALRASRPYRKGAMSWCDFSALCRREYEDKIRVLTPKCRSRISTKTESNRKNKSFALSFSRSATAPSRREPLFVRAFFFVPRKKATAKSKFSKLKVCTFFLCGSAAFHHEPSSGRKVSRVERDGRSLRDGKWQKVAVFHICDFEFRSPFFQETVEI